MSENFDANKEAKEVINNLLSDSRNSKNYDSKKSKNYDFKNSKKFKPSQDISELIESYSERSDQLLDLVDIIYETVLSKKAVVIEIADLSVLIELITNMVNIEGIVISVAQTDELWVLGIFLEKGLVS